MNAFALIVAGGSGSRFAADTPKQFLMLGEKEVLAYSLEAFEQCEKISGIVVCAQPSWQAHVQELCKEHGVTKFLAAARAGENRRASVRAGLETLRDLTDEKNSVVLVHDAARPFLPQDVILRNIEAAARFGACCTAVAQTDTPLLSSDGERLEKMPPRRMMYNSQTPQSFRLDLLLDAHARVPLDAPDITDDCALALACGYEVKLVRGSRRLMKITHRQDLTVARALVEEKDDE